MSIKRNQAINALLVIMGLGLGGHVAGTQYVAKKIGYDDNYLGEPARVDPKSGLKTYWPWKIHIWGGQYWGGRIDDILKFGWSLSFGGLGLGIIGGGFCLLYDPKKIENPHGTAKWATDEEIKKAGLTRSPEELLKEAKKTGKPDNWSSCVVIGKTKDGKIIYDSTVSHLGCASPTRSGKGVGLVIPTGLSWTSSVVFTDVKGEIFQITGWWRSLFSHVIYFNPASLATARYNPLLEIRRGINTIRDVGNISTILCPDPDKGDVIWSVQGRKILDLGIIHTLFTADQKTLGEVARVISDVRALITQVQTTPYEDPHIAKFMATLANELAAKEDKQLEQYSANAQTSLALWTDPLIQHATSASDFRLRDLQWAENPVSLYLVIPVSDIKRVGPLIRLMITQIMDRLMEGDPDDDEGRHRLLMMLDEFPQFGRIQKVEESMAVSAGYGIKWFPIGQGFNQYDAAYGQNHSVISNCHIKLAYRANIPENAKRIADMLGEATFTKNQQSQSVAPGWLGGVKSKNKSVVEFGRPLLTTGEVLTLDQDRLIIVESGRDPILAYKVTYYNDPHFLPRFAGKKLQLPSKPLEDFPRLGVSDPWTGKKTVTVGLDEGMSRLALHLGNPDVPTSYETQEDLEGREPQQAYDPDLNPTEKIAGVEADENIGQVSADMTPEYAKTLLSSTMSTEHLERVDVGVQVKYARKQGASEDQIAQTFSSRLDVIDGEAFQDRFDEPMEEPEYEPSAQELQSLVDEQDPIPDEFSQEPTSIFELNLGADSLPDVQEPDVHEVLEQPSDQEYEVLYVDVDDDLDELLNAPSGVDEDPLEEFAQAPQPVIQDVMTQQIPSEQIEKLARQYGDHLRGSKPSSDS